MTNVGKISFFPRRKKTDIIQKMGMNESNNRVQYSQQLGNIEVLLQ